MADMAQLRFSPLSSHTHNHNHHFLRSDRLSSTVSLPTYPSLSHSTPKNLRIQPTSPESLQLCFSGGSGGIRGGAYGGHGGGGHSGGGGYGGSSGGSDSSASSQTLGIIGMFLDGWRSRVAADPQFPFKVLMEEVVGVSAGIIGDMASRPNFGLNELDFVFSTLVVSAIVNFTLMYLLAPTATSAAGGALLPGIFSTCPSSHMFEPGSFSLFQRCGTYLYKGAVFAAVGFAAGLVGTALSNGLIKLRKKMDPNFETPNKPPPTILNAATWALHMGFNSNLRYQTLNGIEFALANALPPAVFKTSVVLLRSLNNVLGGMSFVILARLTGSQSVEDKETPKEKFA